MSEAIKDCPFCGSVADLQNDFGVDYWVQCTDLACGSVNGIISCAPSRAIESWNKRPAPMAADGVLPELIDLPIEGDYGYHTKSNVDNGMPLQHYSAAQMRRYAENYARAAIAATGPNAALVEALRGMLGIWNMLCDANGWERDHVQQQKDAISALAAAGAKDLV